MLLALLMGKQALEWLNVEMDKLCDCETMKDAMALARTLEGGRWAFNKPSGNLRRNAYFICKLHVACERELRVTLRSNAGTYEVAVRGQHGPVVNERKRANSTLTLAQEDELRVAMSQGSRPGQVWASWNARQFESSMKKGLDPLHDKEEDSTGKSGTKTG